MFVKLADNDFVNVDTITGITVEEREILPSATSGITMEEFHNKYNNGDYMRYVLTIDLVSGNKIIRPTKDKKVLDNWLFKLVGNELYK